MTYRAVLLRQGVMGSKMTGSPKFVLLDMSCSGGGVWRFIKDEKELGKMMKNGIIEEGDFVIKVEAVSKAVEKRTMKLESTPVPKDMGLG